jgi:hypothetical protein
MFVCPWLKHNIIRFRALWDVMLSSGGCELIDHRRKPLEPITLQPLVRFSFPIFPLHSSVASPLDQTPL